MISNLVQIFHVFASSAPDHTFVGAVVLSIPLEVKVFGNHLEQNNWLIAS